MTRGGVRVTVVRGTDEVQRLQPRWDALAAASPDRTPLAGADFLMPMRAALAPMIEPCCVVAWRGREITAVLPLGLDRVRRGLVRLRRLVPLAGRHAYFTDATISPDADASVVTGLVDGFMTLAKDCDDALLMRIPTDSRLGRELMERPGLECRLEPRNRVAPPQPLHGRAGHELRRRLRRLAERAPSAVRDITVPEEVHAGFLAFADLHTRMAPARGLDAVLADPAARRRAAGVMERRAACGEAGIIELHVDGAHAASQVWLRDGNTVIAYRSAWDVAWMPYAVGLHVIEQVAVRAVDAGASALELGPGAEHYKLGWGPTDQTVLRVRLVNRTWRQRVAWRTRRWDPPPTDHTTGAA